MPVGAWRKFHKVTPVADAGTFWFGIISIAVIIVVQSIEDFINVLGFFVQLLTGFRLAMGLLVLLGVSAVFVGIGAVMWRHKSYAVVASGIHYRGGVVIKKYQHVRWDRIQSVEVEQKLFGRIFGFGSVKVEAAGFGEEPVDLGLLKVDQCHQLRTEILTGLARVREKPAEHSSDRAPVLSDGDSRVMADSSTDTEHLIYQLSTSRLVFSTVLTGHALFALAGLVAAGIWQFVFDNGLSIAFLFIILGSVFSSISYISTSYGTKLFVASTGLKSRHGLTKLVTRSLPPTRIHAVSIKQPLLWRRFDWWQIRVTVAGDSLKEAANDGNIGALVPCASREEVLAVVATIFPTLGSDNDAVLMNELMYRRGDSQYLHTPPRRARWIDPIAGTVGAYFANTEVFAIRRGRFWRQVQLIFQDHTQSTSLNQGPIQRFFGLASIGTHVLPGPCDGYVKNFDVDQMRELLIYENELTKQARAVEVSESIDEWKRRLGLIGADHRDDAGE